MERTEKIGIGVATAGHVLLFGLLSTTLLGTPEPLKLNSPPIDVSMVNEIDMKSAGPKVSFDPPPPSEAPEQGPTEEAAPAPAPTPEPEVTPAPPPPKPAPPKQAAPKAKPKPPAPPPKAEPKKAPVKEAPKQTAAKPATATGKGQAQKPKGSLLGPNFLDGITSSTPAKTKTATPPAASVGPQQKAALDAEIRRQLKPYWKAPTGADADQLRTVVAVELNPNGSLASNPEIVGTTGVTDSNRTQVQLHQELAIKAIRLASPFKLPADLYDGWKSLHIGFDRRLSQ